MKHFLLFTVLCSLFIVLSGCAREKLPDGLPNLFDASVSITLDGQPLENASVGLIPENAAENGTAWGAVASTDKNGKAEFYTNGKYKGVAAGQYKVTVIKTVSESTVQIPPKPTGSEKEISDWHMKWIDNPPPQKIYRLTSTQYDDDKKTPLTAEVVAEKKSPKNAFTFDLGKSIREEIKPPRL
jgi:hypothetical protein